jgi:hypothetical protein
VDENAGMLSIGETKVEASIAEDYLSCIKKQIPKENIKETIFFFHEYENCYKFQNGKIRVAYN